MRPPIAIILFIALGSIGACSSLNDEQRLAHSEMMESLSQESADNATIRQSTVFPYHFVSGSPTLNELGEHDLDILATHYRDHIMTHLEAHNIIRNVRVLFDYNKSAIRRDAQPLLDDAIEALEENPMADLIITGHADVRGSVAYNERLGMRRANSVRTYLAARGVDDRRVRGASRGEMEAIAPVGDEAGMQADRNAQFVVAELQEFPVALNVRQGDVSDELYDIRKRSVLSFLDARGLDTSLIVVTDGPVGGDARDSVEVYVIIMDTALKAPRYSQGSTTISIGGGG